MSIIADALSRIQEEMSEEEEGSPDKIKPDFPLPKLRGDVGGRRVGKGFSAFGIIVFVAMAVGVVLWFAVNKVQKQKVEQAGSQTAKALSATAAPNPLSASGKPVPAAQPAPVVNESKEKPGNDVAPKLPELLTDKPAVLVKTEKIAENSTAVAKDVKEDKAQQPAIENIKAPEITLPAVEKQDLKLEPVEITRAEVKTVVTKKSAVVISGKTNKKSQARLEKPKSQATVEFVSNESGEAWLAAGRKALKKDGLLSATAIWEEGLRTLPDHRIVLLVGSFRDPQYAKTVFRLAGQKYSVLIVRGKSEGVQAYYVLSAPLAEDLEKARSYIKKKLGLKVVKGNWAVKLIERISMGKAESRKTAS